MRVLLDTNILFSAFVWPHSKPRKVLEYVALNHILVICSQTLMESFEVFLRKAPSKMDSLDDFFSYYPIELIPAISLGDEVIRDETDQPILNAAMLYKVDIIVTGDKDFLSLPLEHPKCLTASEFVEKYMQSD